MFSFLWAGTCGYSSCYIFCFSFVRTKCVQRKNKAFNSHLHKIIHILKKILYKSLKLFWRRLINCICHRNDRMPLHFNAFFLAFSSMNCLSMHKVQRSCNRTWSESILILTEHKKKIGFRRRHEKTWGDAHQSENETKWQCKKTEILIYSWNEQKRNISKKAKKIIVQKGNTMLKMHTHTHYIVCLRCWLRRFCCCLLRLKQKPIENAFEICGSGINMKIKQRQT